MTGALMAYAPVSAAVDTPSSGPLVDHTHGLVFNFALGDGANTGIRNFDAYPNGNELRSRNVADLGTSLLYTPQCFLANQQQLAIVSGATNNVAIGFFRSTDLSQILANIGGGAKLFGTIGSTFYNDADHIELPTQMCCMSGGPSFSGGANDFILANTINDKIVNLIDANRLVNDCLGPVTEDFALVGAQGDGLGAVGYALGYWTDTTKSLGLYSVKPGVLSGRIGTIAPSDIDATWTHITSVYGISVDMTDGNPIIAAATTDSVTDAAYIIKLNRLTAHIIWAIPVGSGIDYGVQDMPRNLIKNGTLYYLGEAAGTLFTINTVAGTVVQSVFSVGATDGIHAGQVSEDVTGSVYFFGSWTETLTHPAYLGNYMLVEGHTGPLTDMTLRYFPVWPPAGGPPVTAIPAASRKRAWSFTLDGHTFYVLDLASEGTFLYDITTSSWSKFITQGLWQWNHVNGCMWGQRIIGGDVATTDVWELQPGALKDNGALDITRVITGGLVKRSRTFSSVELFRLAVSVGQIDDTAGGASVLLEFSDDQGETYTALDPIALMEGDYSDEIAWRSIGAFAAPGRVFRITDVGGFLRIDGADAMIDNFDEEAPPGQQGG